MDMEFALETLHISSFVLYQHVKVRFASGVHPQGDAATGNILLARFFFCDPRGMTMPYDA